MRILIAEDDPLIGAFVEKGLRASGMTTVLVPDGLQAEELGLSGEFDLLVLDMGLPGQEGFHVLQNLRARGSMLPVLVLTGQPGHRDAAACLEAGADDYMPKPFRFEELLARVRARVHRPAEASSHILVSGRIRLDLWTREASVDGRTVALTAREFALLETSLRHPGQVLSREQLLSDVWGFDFDPQSNVAAVYINGLRKKLGPGVVETVRGFGYRLVT